MREANGINVPKPASQKETNMNKAFILTLCLAVMIIVVSGQSSCQTTTPGATYTTDMKPIFDKNCIACHATTKSGSQRNGAPVGIDYDNYTVAKANGKMGNSAVQKGSMPPAGPLSQADKDTFQSWIDGGMPQ
jgi:cytochrome c5